MAEENYELEDETLSEPFDFEDEFDRLRQKTARTSAVYDEMELEEGYSVPFRKNLRRTAASSAASPPASA